MFNIKEKSEKFGENLSNKVNNKIEKAVDEGICFSYTYTHADLTSMVNEEETLEEYIRDSEEEFDLPTCNLLNLSLEELNSYIKRLDSLW